MRTILCLLLCSLSASATTYYVSPSTGLDSNSGTASGTPWQTISKLNSTSFSVGDTVNFLDSPKLVWTASFVDEFTGSSLNTSNWNTTWWDGSRTLSYNGDVEWYTDTNYSLASGILSIIGNNDSPHSGYTYSSGMMTTYAKFSLQYGRVEMRAKVPHGSGLWPAFWLMPSTTANWPPEIDALEMFSYDTNKFTSSMHFHDYLNQARHLSYLPADGATDYSSAFHVWAVDWSPTALVYYLDGVETFRQVNRLPAEPMYIIVNMSMGGIAGAPSGITWPVSYQIDYVRAWIRTPQGN